MRPSILAGVLALASSAQAADAQRLSLTIYNSDLALVEDARTLDIAAGRQRLEFKDVSARIRPETVALAAPGVEIVEQNFDYDLLTPAKMMEKAVGKQVQIVRTNPGDGKETRETATVLSVNDGVVLKIGDRIEVLRDDGVPTRVIFDGIPENLRARPTLSVTVQSARAGAREARLSYLTHGMGWKADYVALFDDKAGKLDLQGWVTLTNTSGVSYPDAEVQLIAGDVSLASSLGEWQQRYQMNNQRRRQGVREAGTEASDQRSVADYYVYPLAQKTTVAQNQTKQVSFLDVKGAAAKKEYVYRAYGFASSDVAQSADVALVFKNSSAAGLGRQLPAGIVRVYMRDQDGEAKFIGENRIDHTPQGSEIFVKTGEAFDVTIQPTLTNRETVSLLRTRVKMSYLLKNARREAVSVRVVQGGLWGRDATISDESEKGERVDASTQAWSVSVPANGEKRLSFTADIGW